MASSISACSFGFELLDDVGDRVVVQGIEDHRALGLAHLAQDLSEVGGVELRQSLHLHVELDVGGRVVERNHRLPGDDGVAQPQEGEQPGKTAGNRGA